MYSGFSVTKEGFSHIEKNKPCQDASGYEVGSHYAIVAVSDGHGGDKYFRSAVGSTLAVSVTLRCLKEFLTEHWGRLIDTSERQRDELLKNLERYIITQWRTEIEKDFQKNPLSEYEAALCNQFALSPDVFQEFFYGATLLCACMTQEYCFSAQIGDGQCVFLHDDGTESTPIEEDERLGFGMTTSLCDEDAINSFRHCFAVSSTLSSVSAIFLATDGVADSYSPESLQQFFRKVLQQMCVDYGFACSQLEEWLPLLSERGSRDDVTIAGIFANDENIASDESNVSSAVIGNNSSSKALKDE